MDVRCYFAAPLGCWGKFHLLGGMEQTATFANERLVSSFLAPQNIGNAAFLHYAPCIALHGEWLCF